MTAEQERIEYLMQEFDFEKVHKAMKAVNWQWYDTGAVPTLSDIKTTARTLLEDLTRDHVTNNEFTSIETGGFIASYEYVGDGSYNKILCLSFLMDKVDY